LYAAMPPVTPSRTTGPEDADVGLPEVSMRPL
jgi:hypothetical protein